MPKHIKLTKQQAEIIRNMTPRQIQEKQLEQQAKNEQLADRWYTSAVIRDNDFYQESIRLHGQKKFK